MASISGPGPSTIIRVKPTQHLIRQHRTFSSTSRRRVRRPYMEVMKNLPSQQSFANRMKDVKASQVPTDLGLIPGTFIRPTWRELSPFSSQWKERLQMDWHHIKQSVTDFVVKAWSAKWGDKNPATGKRITSSLWFRDRLSVAESLHRQLYTALAVGDRQTVQKVACLGLAQEQTTRLERRTIQGLPPQQWSMQTRGSRFVTNPRFSSRCPWPLQKLFPSSYKIVADRQAPLPFGTNSLMRQIIYRVTSKQTLNKSDGSKPTTQKITEYLVVQRLTLDNKAGDWLVWGTVKPSTYDDLLKIHEMSGGGSMGTKEGWAENIKSRMGGMMGM